MNQMRHLVVNFLLLLASSVCGIAIIEFGWYCFTTIKPQYRAEFEFDRQYMFFGGKDGVFQNIGDFFLYQQRWARLFEQPLRFQATSRSCSYRHARPNSTVKKISGSNRIFKSFGDIVDHCCYAWNTLVVQPWKIMSIARRDWAAQVTQSEDWY